MSEHGMTNNRGICLSIVDWIPAFRPEVWTRGSFPFGGDRPLDDAGMTDKNMLLQECTGNSSLLKFK